MVLLTKVYKNAILEQKLRLYNYSGSRMYRCFMVQNVTTSPNGYGAVNRIGMTNNGRVVYQVVDPTGKEAGKMSVAQRDADTFEKSYRTMMESAPKLQHYTETTTPEQMQKKQKMAKWVVAGCGLLGGIVPLLKAKGNGFWGAMKQVGLTLLGTGAGLVGGIYIAGKMATPPGAMEFTKATQTISKLDIQPIQE